MVMCYHTQKQPQEVPWKGVLNFAFRVPGRCMWVGLFLEGSGATSLQPWWK